MDANAIKNRVFCIKVMEMGMADMKLQPVEMMDDMMLMISFLAVTFRKNHMSHLDTKDFIMKAMAERFDDAFNSKASHAAHEDVQEFLEMVTRNSD